MSTVLMAWELGGGAGHCAKLAPIAKGLIACGHGVSVAARDLVTARNVFENLKVEYFQAPYLSGRPLNPVVRTRTLADILHNTGFGNTTSLEVLYAAWRSIFAAAKPDLLICDHAPMALLASRWYRIRRVVVGTGFTVPPFQSPLPDLRYWLSSSASLAELQRDEEIILGRVNELLARDGADQLSCLADLYPGAEASFLTTFHELDHYPQREAAPYWGMWSRPGGATPEWPTGHPRLFAYLKPPAANWRLGDMLSFLRESRLPAVVYVAGGDPGWLCKFQTTWLRIANEFVDIPHAAKNCDVAILNGNAGSVTALLLAGVPQLNLPLYLEQFVLSRRVADLGAGLYANPARPEQIAARLMAVLQDDRYRQAAQDFSRRYAQFDPQRSIDKMVLMIHQLLSS